MGHSTPQTKEIPAFNEEPDYGRRTSIMMAGLAVLAGFLMVAMGAPASAQTADYGGEVELQTQNLNGTTTGSTTVHGDGSALPRPLAGYCGSAKNPPVGTPSGEYQAAQAPFFQGGSVTVTIKDTGGNCNTKLPSGEYHVSIVEHGFTNLPPFSTTNGIATYSHDEIQYDCTRKGPFVGGSANHSFEFTYTRGEGSVSATVPYFFTANVQDPSGRNTAGGVCISTAAGDGNGGIMIPFEAF
jgi:hypothetical protein